MSSLNFSKPQKIRTAKKKEQSPRTQQQSTGRADIESVNGLEKVSN